MSSSISLFSFLLVLSSAHGMAAQITARSTNCKTRCSLVRSANHPSVVAHYVGCRCVSRPLCLLIAAPLHAPLTPVLPALREGPWRRSSSAAHSEGMNHGTSRATPPPWRGGAMAPQARSGSYGTLELNHASTSHATLTIEQPLPPQRRGPAPCAKLQSLRPPPEGSKWSRRRE